MSVDVNVLHVLVAALILISLAEGYGAAVVRIISVIVPTLEYVAVGILKLRNIVELLNYVAFLYLVVCDIGGKDIVSVNVGHIVVVDMVVYVKGHSNKTDFVLINIRIVGIPALVV